MQILNTGCSFCCMHGELLPLSCLTFAPCRERVVDAFFGYEMEPPPRSDLTEPGNRVKLESRLQQALPSGASSSARRSPAFQESGEACDRLPGVSTNPVRLVNWSPKAVLPSEKHCGRKVGAWLDFCEFIFLVLLKIGRVQTIFGRNLCFPSGWRSSLERSTRGLSSWTLPARAALLDSHACCFKYFLQV